MMEQARYVRDALDNAGFRDVPTCLNEWLPHASHEKLGTALQAAEIAAALIAFQNGPVDSAAIYDARCAVGNYSPLFNPLTYAPPKAIAQALLISRGRNRTSTIPTGGWCASRTTGAWTFPLIPTVPTATPFST